MSYRFAFDAGANSLGWSVLELDANNNVIGIEALGVRIYPDSRNPKDKTSLAVARRIARQMRRRRDRFLDRQAYLMRTLIELGLMPANEASRKELEKVDPYNLRRKGLDHDLTAFELGRVLFHLNQRRGFKSNRKANKDQEGGKLNNYRLMPVGSCSLR
jgi:CRISPR-associated endonuclease Csn1